jgi:hypothetical protein
LVTGAVAQRVAPVVVSVNATVPVPADGETVAVNVSELPYVGEVGARDRAVVVRTFPIVTVDDVVTTVASVDATTEEIDKGVAPGFPAAVNGRLSAGRDAPAAVVPV